MNLLEAMTTSPCSLEEQPSIVGDDRTGSPDHATSARGTSPTLEAIEKVVGTNLVVPAGLSTTALLPEDRTKAMTPPALNATVGGVGSSGTATQSLEMSLRQTGANPELGLFLQKRLSRWPSGRATSSRGSRNSRPSP